QRRADGLLNPAEQSIREEILSDLLADKRRAAQISTAMRVLAVIIASDVLLLVTLNHAIDGVIQNNPKARANSQDALIRQHSTINYSLKKITFKLNSFFRARSLLLLKRLMLLSSLSVMSLVRKRFIAGAVWLGLELLCLGCFNSWRFAWSNSHPTARLTAMTSADATPSVLESPAKGDDGSVAANNGDTTYPGFFSATSGPWQVLVRRLAVSVSFSQILTPKVSRYISKSVLML